MLTKHRQIILDFRALNVSYVCFSATEFHCIFRRGGKYKFL